MEPKFFDLIEDYVASLPTIYFQINQALEEDVSFEEIASIISADASLTARLLKIVNSPFYGFPQKIETISHALSIAGTKELQLLALATTIMNSFEGGMAKTVNRKSFWRHCIGCGLIAKEIAVLTEMENPERYYIAGMLHDIGSLVIFNKMPETAMEAVELCETKKEYLYKVENKILGFNHMEVGSHLLKAWNLPESLVAVAAYHHEPKRAKKHTDETRIVHMADILSHEWDLGNSGESLIPRLDIQTPKKIGFAKEHLEGVKEKVLSDFDEAAQLFL